MFWNLIQLRARQAQIIRGRGRRLHARQGRRDVARAGGVTQNVRA